MARDTEPQEVKGAGAACHLPAHGFLRLHPQEPWPQGLGEDRLLSQCLRCALDSWGPAQGGPQPSPGLFRGEPAPPFLSLFLSPHSNSLGTIPLTHLSLSLSSLPRFGSSSHLHHLSLFLPVLASLVLFPQRKTRGGRWLTLQKVSAGSRTAAWFSGAGNG